MNRPALLALAAAALLVAGCGGASSSSSSSTPPPGAGAVVKMANIAFTPKELTVRVGQTVQWQNVDSVQHNVVADTGARFHSRLFGMGGTFSFTPRRAGMIAYECTVHPGMTATLRVVR